VLALPVTPKPPTKARPPRVAPARRRTGRGADPPRCASCRRRRRGDARQPGVARSV